jgi:hypothetical protein
MGDRCSGLLLLINSTSMKPSHETPESQEIQKNNQTFKKQGRHAGGYTPYGSVETHEIPGSCNIKPRDISFVESSILLVP